MTISKHFIQLTLLATYNFDVTHNMRYRMFGTDCIIQPPRSRLQHNNIKLLVCALHLTTFVTVKNLLVIFHDLPEKKCIFFKVRGAVESPASGPIGTVIKVATPRHGAKAFKGFHAPRAACTTAKYLPTIHFQRDRIIFTYSPLA